MLPALHQQIISLGLLGLGVYFTVQLARGLAGYLRFRRVAPRARSLARALAPARQWIDHLLPVA